MSLSRRTVREQMSNEAIPAQDPIGVNVSQPTPLLPCPFCGADVTMGKNREGAKIIYFQVECDECGAIAGSGYTTEPAAAKNWNRRANVKVTRPAGGGSGAAKQKFTGGLEGMVATKREMSDGEIYESFSRRANPEAHAAIEATMHELFDGSEPGLIEAERKLFEADAEQYGFDLTRHQCAAPEPWSEYASEVTGHRWGGWLAARAMPSNLKVTPPAEGRSGEPKANEG